jgi:DivIVA domain-containing protein
MIGRQADARVLCCAAVDRDEIQRRDFPTGRRGYDPAAVDEHLRQVADAFDRKAEPPAPLSSGASEQVRVILEAAERGAAELRAKAGEEAGDHVARVREAADGLRGRLDELEGELNTLLEALRKSSERLSQGLTELQARVAQTQPAGKPEDPRAAELDAQLAESADDEAGARLIALNMALGGTPREETARYLAEHFELADLEALLDDVYSRAGQ